MSLITLKDLSLARSAPLFSGLDLAIAKGDRLGLVAANGRGKSSLLRIMAGEEEATGGTLTRARGLVIAFAPQDPPERLLPMSLYDAVRDALDPEAAETESWRVDVLLDDLMVEESLRSRAVGSLRDHLDPEVLQQHPQPLTEDRVVVGDHDPQPCAHP